MGSRALRHTLPERDCEQIALQLTGHARAVAADVRCRAEQLPAESGRRALADVVLLEATACCVQDRARLVHAIYERLDRLQATSVDWTA